MIASVGYDAKAQILEIQFLSSGDIWQYEEVSEEVYQDFMKSNSKGRFFLENIRGGYEEYRVR
jgi:hypothetical protein